MKKRFLLLCLILSLLFLCGCGAAEEAEAAIDAIGKVSLDSGKAIDYADSLLDALSARQLGQVENLDDFSDARRKYEQLCDLYDEAEDAINAIGTVTPKSGKLIEAAREAYDALEEEDLTEYAEDLRPILTDAESTYKRQTDILSTARDAIDAIGTVSLDSKDALDAAWDAWEEVKKADLLGYFEEETASLQAMDDQFLELNITHLYDSAVSCFAQGDFENGLAYTVKLRDGYADSAALQELTPIAVNAMLEEAQAMFNEELLQSAENLLAQCYNTFPSYCSTSDAYNSQLTALESKLESIRPKTGKVLHNSTGSGYGTMHITAGSEDALIKLESIENPEKYQLIYIRSGETATFSVYSGDYILKYTTGSQWYGTKEMFGADAVFTKADDTFTFSIAYSGNYVYYTDITVTLYSVFGGTLASEDIDPSDF